MSPRTTLRGATVGTATVVSSQSDGVYRLLTVDAPYIAAHAQPGQFVSVAQEATGHILRRPFSVLAAGDGRIEIGFDAIGDGTRWLASRRAGDRLDVIGPLGRPYAPLLAGTALLVGGGYGSAPLIFFAERLRDAGVRSRLILGAATKDRLFCEARARAVADTVTVTTDDGSAGIRGRVTDAMKDESGYDAVYACGPMPMLAAVTRATPDPIPVEVAVEEFMACGIGVCWTCVVPTHEEGYRHHVRSCIEGPVFDGRMIAWA